MLSRTTRFGLIFTLALGLVACGGGDDDSGTSDAATNDAAEQADADTTPDGGLPDADVSPDAFVANLDCAGDTLPTTSPNPGSIGGTMLSFDTAGNAMPIANSTIDLYESNQTVGDTPVATTTTNSMGVYSFTGIDTENSLKDYYLHGQPDNGVLNPGDSTYVADGLLFFGVPFVANIVGRDIALFADGTRNIAINLLGISGITHDPANGIILVVFEDCNGNRLPGATIAVNAGTVVYGDDIGLPNSMATASGGRGVAWVVNVPPGDITLTPAFDGTDFRVRTVKAIADSRVTSAIVVP